MKIISFSRQLLSAAVLIGLMMGCGGDPAPENKPTGGDDNQSAAPKKENNKLAAPKVETKKADLAAFLVGKRILMKMPMPPNAPPPPPNTPIPEIIAQFEADGILKRGMSMNGQAFGLPGKTMYKVAGMKVTILKDGKEDGAVTFQSANPKKGDKMTFQQSSAAAEQATTISGIEKASALKPLPEGGPGGPDGPDGPGGLGGPAFGLGPNGEFAKSKHPAFIAHTWKTDPFSRGTKHSATFGKEGVLTITPEKGKPLKGTWEVAGPRITLTYPDPETGKEKALEYQFLFGGGESEGADGKTIEIESLILKGAGNNKSSIVYERLLPTGGENPEK